MLTRGIAQQPLCVYDKNTTSPFPRKPMLGCSCGQTWTIPPGGQNAAATADGFYLATTFFFPATCDASFFGCFSSHLGPARDFRFHRRLGESGREQTVKKHRSVTKPAALHRHAKQALRLPPEL